MDVGLACCPTTCLGSKVKGERRSDEEEPAAMWRERKRGDEGGWEEPELTRRARILFPQTKAAAVTSTANNERHFISRADWWWSRFHAAEREGTRPRNTVESGCEFSQAEVLRGGNLWQPPLLCWTLWLKNKESYERVFIKTTAKMSLLWASVCGCLLNMFCKKSTLRRIKQRQDNNSSVQRQEDVESKHSIYLLPCWGWAVWLTYGVMISLTNSVYNC